MKGTARVQNDSRSGYRVCLAGLESAPPVEEVLAMLDEPGEVLKASSKAVTRRSGPYVFKSVTGGPFRKELLSWRNRRTWRVAKELTVRGVAVPEPVAYLERRVFGLTCESILVTRFLDGYTDVESYARQLDAEAAAPEQVSVFLRGLAGAVTRLWDAGARHSDLSGKNIFVKGGTAFCFIDLDALKIDGHLTGRRLLKAHVQLYDSFCDLWDDTILAELVEHLSAPQPIGTWLPEVRAAQRRRRTRIEAIWAREGRPAGK